MTRVSPKPSLLRPIGSITILNRSGAVRVRDKANSVKLSVEI